MRRTNPEAARRHNDRKTIIIHGVPEPATEDKISAWQHDCSEWRYIQELLGLRGILTTSISRLNPPEKLLITCPRLLKIIVRTPEMAQQVLEMWYSKRALAPPEIRMRAPYERKAKNAQNTVISSNTKEDINKTLEASVPNEAPNSMLTPTTPTKNETTDCTNVLKNGFQPTSLRSAQRTTQ